MARLPVLCLLLPALLAPAGPAAGHPDLLAQIEALDLRLLESPGDAGLLLKRADLHRRHGDYRAARLDLAAARHSNPGLIELDIVEGRVNLESGRPEAALACFDRYLAAEPGQAKALRLRAEARLALGQAAQAAADFGRAIANTPKPSPALYRRHALALLAAGQPRWADARAVIDTALARFPVEVSLLGLGADVALAQGRPGAARAYIGKLPPALQDLPQWRARIVLARALASEDPQEKTAAREAARESLDRQLEAVRPVP